MLEYQITEVLIDYISTYGYYIVFLALLLENFFVTGLVVPGETVLLAAAAFAGQSSLNVFYLGMTAIVAATLGNIVGYVLGRKGGRPLIEKFGRRFVSEERIGFAEAFFDKHGPKTIVIGRFAAGVRVFVPLLAGASKMNFAKFIAYTAAAVVSWTVLIVLLGFFFGQNWPLIKNLLGRFSFVVLALVIVLIVIYLIRRKREATLD